MFVLLLYIQGVHMKIDRLIGILSVLLQQKKITAPELADKFEVSKRTSAMLLTQRGI